MYIIREKRWKGSLSLIFLQWSGKAKDVRAFKSSKPCRDQVNKKGKALEKSEEGQELRHNCREVTGIPGGQQGTCDWNKVG